MPGAMMLGTGVRVWRGLDPGSDPNFRQKLTNIGQILVVLQHAPGVPGPSQDPGTG